MRTLAASLGAALFAAVLAGPAQAQDYTFRVTHEMAAQDAINIAAVRFAERVMERSGGRIDVKVFPAAQIGHDNDTLEQTKAGASLIVITNPGGAAGAEVPDLTVLDGPYLFDTLGDYRTLINSDWFASASDQLEQKGRLKMLAANWLFGVRHLITDHPVRSPDEIVGLKMRIPPLEMWVETFKALEANAQAINWGEVYTALSSGVVDAVEAPLESIWAAKFYEVKKTISMTGHFTNWISPIMSAEVFASMPADLQAIMLEESEIAGEIITALALDREQGFREKLEGEGVTFVADVDREAFSAKSKVTYSQISQWTPGLYETVRTAMGK
jgi:tripartite ATP-independent transporter DctP family solute receptor